MSSDADANKIKKQIVIRYPLTFYEEISRTLAIFKTLRGNKKIFRALPVFDELLDYACMDPKSGKWVYDMKDDEKSKLDIIDIPKSLITSFKEVYHGSKEEYDGIIGLKHLAPGTSVDDGKATVIIRKPMRWADAYGDHSAEWVALKAGFNYKISLPSPYGFPITQTVAMIEADDKDLEWTFTTDIPRSVWVFKFETLWGEVAPVCSRAERLFAAVLTAKNIPEAVHSMADLPTDDSQEFDDPLDLS